MVERKQYAKPPLLEVICEIRFEPADGEEWDGLLLATFYERLGRERFPRKNRPEGTRENFSSPATPRHQFLSADGNTIVQVGEQLLAVNQLPPGYRWETFEQEVLGALLLYLDLWKPRRIRWAGLHCTDRIEIPGETINLPDWFNLYPVLPAMFQDRPVANLAMAFEAAGSRPGDVLAIVLHQQPSANPELNPIHIQWNYVATQGVEANREDVRSWLALAHEATGAAFRASLTPRCETLFGPG
jgi:uncharacterized protein (TIGR04255 family)